MAETVFKRKLYNEKRTAVINTHCLLKEQDVSENQRLRKNLQKTNSDPIF